MNHIDLIKQYYVAEEQLRNVIETEDANAIRTNDETISRLFDAIVSFERVGVISANSSAQGEC